jgi:acyl-CoA synthetase (AMP-forming)/AMP-acid ligase II
MTETCSMVTYLDGRSEPGHRNSVGKPLPVTDTKLLPLPQSDTDFAAGADVGELAVRGPQVALGYWADGALAPLTDADGWLATGDAVRFDDEFVVLVGRIKDVIKRGGESIFAVEVEDVLHQHPDVLEAALVGVPDVAWGQLPVAVVVARPGRKPDPSDVIAFCRARLAPYKTPSAVRIVPELPRNAGGKVLKAVLVAEAAGDATESPSSGLPGPSTERWPYERGPATRR